MLRDDRAAGSKASMLLASHTGGKLYPTVGYETIGELLMFGPPRRLAASLADGTDPCSHESESISVQ